jgi:predicted O-methyltransferase YrrM
MADLIYYEVGAWSHGYARGSRFFCISDIYAMLRKLAEHEHNIHLRSPGAHQALKNFKIQQREKVSFIRGVSSISCYRTMVELY